VPNFRWTAVACFVFTLGVSGSSASDIAKLAPEPVVVHLQNGFGSEKVVFFKGSGTSISKVVATQASGRVATIAQADIRAVYEPGPVPSLFNVVLEVKTQQAVEHGVPYKGVLLVFTQSDKSPDQFPFSIQDDAIVNVEALQANIDVFAGVWQPERYRIIIRNNGKTSISDLLISSSNLVDAGSGHRILLKNANADWGKGAIAPDEERPVSFDLPMPPRAGTFVGQLYITANQAKTVGVPFSLRSRGPLGRTVLPFALFCVVLILGFWVSSVLDDWFGGGGLVRAQAYLSLKSSRSALVRYYFDIQEWKTRVPTNVPSIALLRTENWLSQGIREIEVRLASIDETPLDQLNSDAQRFALLVGAITLLWSAVQSAMSKWSNQPAQLQLGIDALDKVSLPASSQDLDRYRKDLLSALSTVTLGAGAAGGEVMLVSPQWSEKKVRRKIQNMARLYRAIVWAAVFITAYQASYAHNLAFGTLSDYLVQFTWALGLTQTGTQILARMHK
jgi:hypothetical protein